LAVRDDRFGVSGAGTEGNGHTAQGFVRPRRARVRTVGGRRDAVARNEEKREGGEERDVGLGKKEGEMMRIPSLLSVLLSSAASTDALHARTDESKVPYESTTVSRTALLVPGIVSPHEGTSEVRFLGGAHGGDGGCGLWTGSGPWVVERGGRAGVYRKGGDCAGSISFFSLLPCSVVGRPGEGDDAYIRRVPRTVPYSKVPNACHLALARGRDVATIRVRRHGGKNHRLVCTVRTAREVIIAAKAGGL
jgi:hypothetical protein